MTTIRELLAENLKKYRHAVGLSQAKLAEKVSTSTYYIGMLEIRRKFPSPEMMERIASALGIDPAELFLRETTPEQLIRSYRKAAVEDIQWRLGQVFEERFRELEKETETPKKRKRKK
ncbi:MAG: helix-turn-helix domain-containing protein [Lachnospiraceae bacterium]|nr:helix-turn-helix domain-containing protein [Lachnospiraceae bacterium]